jgi:hypothetical protein
VLLERQSRKVLHDTQHPNDGEEDSVDSVGEPFHGVTHLEVQGREQLEG